MKSVDKLRRELHERVLRLRSVEHVIHQSLFERLWTDSSEEERVVAEVYINAGNRQRLVNWIRNHKSIDYGEMTLQQLRRVGNIMAVPNYSRLSKIELLSAIEEEKRYEKR